MMFCSNCGCNITKEEKFCSKCGEKNKNFFAEANIQTAPNHYEEYQVFDRNGSDEFDRNVLNNYLNTLQTLEFAKNRLIRNKNELESQIGGLAREKYVPKSLVDFETQLCTIVYMAVFFVIALLINFVINSKGFLSIFDFLQPIVTIVLWGSPIITIICVINMIYEKIKDIKRYERAIDDEEARMKREQRRKESCIVKVDTTKSEW